MRKKGNERERECTGHIWIICCSENQLTAPGDMAVLSPAFTLVSVLSMNKMNLQWDEVTLLRLLRDSERTRVTILHTGAVCYHSYASVGRASRLQEQD